MNLKKNREKFKSKKVCFGGCKRWNFFTFVLFWSPFFCEYTSSGACALYCHIQESCSRHLRLATPHPLVLLMLWLLSQRHLCKIRGNPWKEDAIFWFDQSGQPVWVRSRGIRKTSICFVYLGDWYWSQIWYVGRFLNLGLVSEMSALISLIKIFLSLLSVVAVFPACAPPPGVQRSCS